MLSRLSFAAFAALAAGAASPAEAPPQAEPLAAMKPVRHRLLEASWRIGSEPLLLRSEPWFSGAVSSVRFRGVEFIDSSDHGRLLQGAISFGGLGECLNPTQAGASRDRRGRTTSQLLWAEVTPASYTTATRMAFWKRPGEHCRPHGGADRSAANDTAASEVVYAQQLTFGHRGYANAVEARITFTTAQDHEDAVVEALTAYAPPGFDSFHLFRGGRLVRDDTVAQVPGEQPDPVVLSTADGASALGFLALTPGPTPGYGRFTFEETSKINLVYRPAGAYRAGQHDYSVVWIIGTRAEVATTLRGLTALPQERKGGWTAFDAMTP